MLEFYVTFDELKEKLDEEAPNKYTNALDFLTKLKFIMAKLTVRPTYAHQTILLITNMQFNTDKWLDIPVRKHITKQS